MSQFFDRIDRRFTDAISPERRAWLQTPRALVLGFIGIHLVFLIALLPTILAGDVLGDLPLYRTWAERALESGVWQGIDVAWVYPAGALLPIALADVAGPYLYQLVWLLMTTALNAAAVVWLTDFGRKASGFRAAWWWLGVVFVLSPVALLRLEGLVAPLVILGLLALSRRPIVATVLLSAATWIKVWPAAVLLAVIAVSRRRAAIIATGIAVSAGVAAMVWAAGGIRFLTGFITEQTDRALQFEAPVTTLWVWLAALGRGGSYIYENHDIATREVAGRGTGLVAEAMTPLMFLALAVILVLLLVALRRTHDPSHLLLLGAMTMVCAFVVLNKVGSPQYMLWIAPIVTVGVARDWLAWRTPAYAMLAIGVLTTLIFPVFYLPLIDGDPIALLLLTARNGLLVALFGWSVVTLWRQARVRATAPETRSARASVPTGA